MTKLLKWTLSQYLFRRSLAFLSPLRVVKNVFHTEMIQIKDVDVQLKLENNMAKNSYCKRLKVPGISALLKRVGGIVVSIAAFQAVDPGSIPGRRIETAFPFCSSL